jgi:hypothetical protein
MAYMFWPRCAHPSFLGLLTRKTPTHLRGKIESMDTAKNFRIFEGCGKIVHFTVLVKILFQYIFPLSSRKTAIHKAILRSITYKNNNQQRFLLGKIDFFCKVLANSRDRIQQK